MIKKDSSWGDQWQEVESSLWWEGWRHTRSGPSWPGGCGHLSIVAFVTGFLDELGDLGGKIHTHTLFSRTVLFRLVFWLNYDLIKNLFLFNILWQISMNNELVWKSIVVVPLLSRVRLFATPWAEHARLPCPSPCPRACSNLSIKSVMLPNHLVLCRALHLLPSVFPSTGVFSNESTLHIRRPNYWNFSFNTSHSNEYSRMIPLGLIGLISLQSKGLSTVLPGTIAQKHKCSAFFMVQLTSKHDYWKNRSFYYMEPLLAE